METFKVICLECGSENVYLAGGHGGSVVVQCLDCENIEADD